MKLAAVWLGLLMAGHLHGQSLKPAQKAPNIIVILADDLGFSDLGCFGSEINTPHLDRLAREGMKLTSFYNSGRCCPSRAALLTGLYPHQAGIGDMVQDKGSPAYQGYLRESSATIAQLLKAAHYNTIVSGKWHVGLVPSALAHNRGFDRSFTMLNNGSSYFNSEPIYNDGRTVTFLLNGEKTERQDTSRYLTQAITDFAVKSLEELRSSPDPFFLYVTYTAPHWPIQALPEDIARYQGKYMQGWDALRRARFAKQKQLGIVDKSWQLSPRYSGGKEWEKLDASARDLWDTRMAIYAAMIDRMDRGIGDILMKLKDIGQDKNTLVIFVSDNGGSADTVKEWAYVRQKNGAPGSAASIDSYYPEWGNASNTPFSLFKKNTHEGGIASPFIAWFPGRIKAGNSGTQVGHLIDLMPTCLDWAGLSYPAELHGKKLTPLSGKSLKPVLTGSAATPARTLFWEHEGSRAMRSGDWKLVAEIHQPWELYNLKTDRTETRNLAGKYPGKVKELEIQYLKWAKEVGVVDWDLIK
ncbi:arylsulfatase [Dyadobacter sandarakinus]|uniref:Arylsulfatase n=1 Tax=Dyadobacter sandarakinus TaxID=2747268 RepID=A0ABX7I6B0_9BACT|nr:arylsulfatase [Dyadobacter sandarakinus]QRR00723.1 arylsulfatase [Dyadobacter sandarakinus]